MHNYLYHAICIKHAILKSLYFLHTYDENSSHYVFQSGSVLPGRSSCPFFIVGHTVSPSNLFRSSSEKFISDMSVTSAVTDHQRIGSDCKRGDIHPTHNRRQIVPQTHTVSFTT